MPGAFDDLQQALKRLPGLGFRSAERLALHLLVEAPDEADRLVALIQGARKEIRSCRECGNLAEDVLCPLCQDNSRQPETLCLVESVPDLRSMERSGAYRGLYHVLHGKLSPIHGVHPEDLNIASLKTRLESQAFREVIFALPNDIEGQATCHYLQEEILKGHDLKLTRIGFGLPSGGGIPYADATTLRSAFEGRRHLD